MFEEILPELVKERGGEGNEGTARTYSSITPKAASACFADGGNAAVFESPAARVEIVRLAGSRYEGRERKETWREEGFLLVRNAVQDGKELIEATGYGSLAFSLSVPDDDPELRIGKERVTLAAVASLSRFLLECGFLKRHGKEDDLLVRDGSLEPNNSHEERALQELIATGKAAGLAKTSTLLTGSGGSAAGEALAHGPREAWLSPVAPREGMAPGVTTAIVKLHARSEHAFRLDATDLDATAAALAVTADDAVFPGYPYPLLEADRLARIPNRELETLKTRLMAEAGDDWKNLQALARGNDAHRLLDRIER